MSGIRLVIGGAGFIGSALTRELTGRRPVRVLDDLSTGRAENLDGLDAELLVGSILDHDTLVEAMQGVDVVYHLACRGVRHSLAAPYENHRVNADGTLLVLEAARRAPVQRLVYTSTSEVYGSAERAPMDEEHPTRPHTVYGASKLAGEAYVRAYWKTYGLPTTVLRPFNSFGPRSHHEGDSGEVIPKFLVRTMNGLAPVIFGDGNQTRDFTYVDDSARGIVAAAERDNAIGQTINLGSGTETSMRQLAVLIAKVTGSRQLEPDFQEPRPGDVHRLVADSRRARTLLEWRPQISLDEGLRRLLRWYEERATDWQAALDEEEVRSWETSSA